MSCARVGTAPKKSGRCCQTGRGRAKSVATSALKVCNHPGCYAATRESYCPNHARRPKDTRGHAAERGYDYQWQKLRKAYWQAHPLCEECARNGAAREAQDIDHIRPFSGKSDPLRLDWSNLQSLCRACHRRKTLKQVSGERGRLPE